MKEEKKCIHEGHRQRLLDTAFKVGVDNLTDVQAMEVLLFYILPRGDVNPLAHRLLNKFGSLKNVVNASAEELKSVEGINDVAAKKIKVFSNLFSYYAHMRMQKNEIVKISEIVDLVEGHLRFQNTEKLLLMAISPFSTLIRTEIVDVGQLQEVSMNMLDFTNFLTSTHAASVVVAHCHPYGTAVPSTADNSAYDKVKQLSAAFGVELVDAYILGEDGVFSQKSGRFMRKYMDAEELEEALPSSGKKKSKGA